MQCKGSITHGVFVWNKQLILVPYMHMQYYTFIKTQELIFITEIPGCRTIAKSRMNRWAYFISTLKWSLPFYMCDHFPSVWHCVLCQHIITIARVVITWQWGCCDLNWAIRCIRFPVLSSSPRWRGGRFEALRTLTSIASIGISLVPTGLLKFCTQSLAHLKIKITHHN